MTFMDVAVFVLATSLVMIGFVSRTDLNKSRVRVRVRNK